MLVCVLCKPRNCISRYSLILDPAKSNRIPGDVFLMGQQYLSFEGGYSFNNTKNIFAQLYSLNNSLQRLIPS